MSEIFDAVKRGDKDKVERLLSEDKSLVFERDEAGNTPLHIAAAGRKSGIAEALLENGAEVNAVNNDGLHPIDVVNDGKYHFVDVSCLIYRMLIKYGAYLARPKYTQRQLSILRLVNNILFTTGILTALAFTYFVIGVCCRWLPKSDGYYIIIILWLLLLLERMENWLRDKLLPYSNMRDNA